MNKADFFDLYGCQLVNVNGDDDTETGAFQLFAPEESDRALEYQEQGYTIASVFEYEDGSEEVVLDNDCSDAPFKIGFLVLDENF